MVVVSPLWSTPIFSSQHSEAEWHFWVSGPHFLPRSTCDRIYSSTTFPQVQDLEPGAPSATLLPVLLPAAAVSFTDYPKFSHGQREADLVTHRLLSQDNAQPWGWLSYPHLLTLQAGCMLSPTGKDPACTCPLPPLARLVRRLSWSSCPSSVPRLTASHCTFPKAVPPSTTGTLLCGIVKVGCGA